MMMDGTLPEWQSAHPYIARKLSVGFAKLSNRLAIPRAAFTFKAIEQDWSLSLKTAPETSDTLVDFHLNIDGEKAILRTAWGLAERAIFAVDPMADLENIETNIAAMLVEEAFIEPIQAFEAALKRQIWFEDFSEATEHTYPSALSFKLERLTQTEPESWPFMLFASTEFLNQCFSLWEKQPLTQNALSQIAQSKVAIRLGSSQLSVTELASLEAGDAVLIDHTLPQNKVLIVLDETLAAAAQLQVETGALQAKLTEKLSDALSYKDFIMTDTPAQTTETPEDVSLNNLPVTLSFELGRTSLSFAELNKLEAGSVISVGGNAKNVNVMINGKRVATGELVAIGEESAIRLTRIISE